MSRGPPAPGSASGAAPPRFPAGVCKPWQANLIAIVATLATLGVALAVDGALESRPALVIFTLPIMLAA